MIVPHQIDLSLSEYPHAARVHGLHSHAARPGLDPRSKSELFAAHDDIVVHKVDPEDPIAPSLEVASVASSKRSM